MCMCMCMHVHVCMRMRMCMQVQVQVQVQAGARVLLLEHEVAVVAAHVAVGPRDVVPRDAALSVALTDPVRLDTRVEGGLQHAVTRDLGHIARRQAPHLVRVRVRVRVRLGLGLVSG